MKLFHGRYTIDIITKYTNTIYKQKGITTKRNVRNYKFRKIIIMLHLLLIMLHYLLTMLHNSQNQRNKHLQE